MAAKIEELLLKLTGPADGVLGEYIRHIANDNGDEARLATYKRIIQWGGKEGQPLYAHVLDLVFTLSRLSEVLRLSSTEQRVLMLVLSVHDLNKAPGYEHLGSYNALATPDNVALELKRIGADGFFPEWREYIRDIVLLMRAHSDHYHVAGSLMRRGGDFRLGQERVEELVPLVQALDIIDLSHELHERKHKQRFLQHLNEFSKVQYEFVHHSVAEQRGILTNVIHNRIAEYMQTHKEAWPLLYYPEGVVYLIRRGAKPEMTSDNYSAVGIDVAEWLENQTQESFVEFIEDRGQGIKIDPKCLELGLSFSRIWQEVHNIIQGKSFGSRVTMNERARGRALETATGDDSDAAKAVRRRLEQSEVVPQQDETLRLGELIRSYYIFLSKHFKNTIPDAWTHLYEMLDIPVEQQSVYAFFNLRYDRAYVLAPDLPLTYEDVLRRIERDGRRLLGEMKTESPWQSVFQRYAQENVQFSFQLPDRQGFATHLRQYVKNNHRQSAYGSTSFDTELWRSGDVPKSVKVQQFSNRLAAGPGDPVKRIDPITKAQFLLEKLNYPPGYKATTFYLHIYPHAFYSPAYVVAWRRTVRNLAEQEISALFIKTDDSLRSIFDESQPIRLPVSTSNSNGLPLPGAPEMLGNLLIWPLNAPGANDTEQFWYAFTCAFAMQRYVGGRVVLSRSAVPIVSSETMRAIDLLIDEIPLSLQGLLRQNSYNYEELLQTRSDNSREGLEAELQALYSIYRQVFNPRSKVNEVLALAQSLNDGPLGVYFTAERLLLQRIRDDKNVRSAEWTLIRAAEQLGDSLDFLAYATGGKEVIETIEKLARLAWEGNLKGKTLEKNSLMMPLDECFTKLQQKEEPVDDGTLRAAAANDIYEYLGRIREVGMAGRTTQLKADAFVDTFFSDLVGTVYQGNRQRLLNDEKLIRSAFLFHVRELLAHRAAERAAEAEAVA